ncbi:MAG: sulfur carrier protein ThiS [Desulfurivibrio sp.]
MSASGSFESSKPTGKIAIICNGGERLIPSGLSVASFITSLGLNPDMMAVELDGRVLDRAAYEKTLLAADARLELIRFVGGG